MFLHFLMLPSLNTRNLFTFWTASIVIIFCTLSPINCMLEDAYALFLFEVHTYVCYNMHKVCILTNVAKTGLHSSTFRKEGSLSKSCFQDRLGNE